MGGTLQVLFVEALGLEPRDQFPDHALAMRCNGRYAIPPLTSEENRGLEPLSRLVQTTRQFSKLLPYQLG